MKTKDTADKLSPWLDKLSEGKTLIYGEHDKSTVFAIIRSIVDLAQAVNDGKYICEYIAKFPEPPEGEEWHNPDKLTPEQVGVDDGWRLLLVSELAKDRDAVIGDMLLSKGWDKGCYGNNANATYRVKTAEHPVGSLKPKVEKPVKCKE